MTNKEAIKELKKVDTLDMPARLCEAHYMAIKALEQEPKTGHKVYGDLLGGLYCSECMTYVNEYFNYCPHCGAKMVEPQESEE
jgi:uncharacterized OB-fold protein